MIKIKIFKNPWRYEFIQLLESSRKKVQLASPFIKTSIAKLISQHTHRNVKIDLLNSFKLPSFRFGASDLKALNILRERGARLRNFQSLHAKIFIFDDERSIITSSNLTPGGLINNYEYGVLIDDKIVSSKIALDFKNIFNNKEYTSTITKQILVKAEKILASMPKLETPYFEIKADQELFKRVSEEEKIIDKIEEGIPAIERNLRGWTKDVFILLNDFNVEVFKLTDVYKFETYFQKIHPNNTRIKAKIRQQLQVLRDLGLLHFLSGGVYRKLWK